MTSTANWEQSIQTDRIKGSFQSPLSDNEKKSIQEDRTIEKLKYWEYNNEDEGHSPKRQINENRWQICELLTLYQIKYQLSRKTRLIDLLETQKNIL